MPASARARPQPPGTIRAFLIADIRGFTHFTARHGDAAAARLAVRFAEIVGEGVEAWGGSLVELRGDEALAVFDSSRAALRAAVELQMAFDDATEAEPASPLLVGIGLDAGEAVPVGDGFRGAALNLAARLCGLAGPGEIRASGGLVHIAGRIDGIGYEADPPTTLKGLDTPVEVVRVRSTEGPRRHPRRIVTAGDRGPLPTELDTAVPLVGRDADRRWLGWHWRLARHGHGRVVVVSGPKGIGKTRLAAAVADDVQGSTGEVVYLSASRQPRLPHLERLAARGLPTLVIADDLEAAAPELVGTLGRLNDVVHRRPVLLLMLCGDSMSAPMRRILGDSVPPERHRKLMRLDDEAIRAIAASYADRSVEPAPFDRIVDESRGVPAVAHRRSQRWMRTATGGAVEGPRSPVADRPSVRERVDSLSARERETLDLARLGLSDVEVATQMSIAPSAVRRHLARATTKLGVRSRAEAVTLLKGLRPSLPAETATDEPPRELPRYLTRFVGRRRQTERAKRLLEAVRLVTLTGTGGVGKTRLALHVANEVGSTYEDGVVLAELAGLTSGTLVLPAIAAALRLREQAGYALDETVVRFLGPRRLLLVLDNCEHLLGACADVADALLRSCPSLSILATSRQPLGIAGETVYPVPPLAVPDPARPPGVGTLATSEAAELFLDRARAASAVFEPTEREAAVVARICHRLDGIPLAIELAAALVRTRPIELIDAGLDDRFRTLVGGSRTAVARQQTLRATVDWSFELLSEPERELLRRLAIFVGPFGVASLRAVCADERLPSDRVVELMTELVDKSLVLLESDLPGGGYRLLETVREFALERLMLSGDLPAMRGRHLDWYMRFAEEATRRDLYGGPSQVESLARLNRELDNLRSALAFSLGQAGTLDAGLWLATSLWHFWDMRGHLAEGRRWLETLLAAADRPVSEIRANALTAAGALAFAQGDYGASLALHERSLAVHRQVGSRLSIAFATHNLASVAMRLGDAERARTLYEEVIAFDREFGLEREQAVVELALAEATDLLASDVEARTIYESAVARLTELAERGEQRGAETALDRSMYAYGLTLFGASRLRHGDSREARDLQLQALQVYRRIDDGRGTARTLSSLAEVASAQGDPGLAASLLLEALSVRLRLDDRPGIAGALERLAFVAAPTDPTRAARLLGAGEGLRAQIGTDPPISERPEREALRSSLETSLGPDDLRAAYAEGRSLALEQAYEEAVAAVGPASTALP